MPRDIAHESGRPVWHRYIGHPALAAVADLVEGRTAYDDEAAFEVAGELLLTLGAETAGEIRARLDPRDRRRAPTAWALDAIALSLAGPRPPLGPLRRAWDRVHGTPLPLVPEADEEPPDPPVPSFEALAAAYARQTAETKATCERAADEARGRLFEVKQRQKLMAKDNVIPWAEAERQRAKAERIAETERWAKEAREKRKFKFVAVGDLELKPTEYLVGDLIETDSFGVLFGEPGCGKSFLAVDLAMCVASGAAFHGRPVRQGPVLFIAGEGHSGLARRFEAWAQERGVPRKGLPLFKSARAAAFLDAAHAREVATAVDALAAEHGAPALIVVDTLARNFGGGDENSTQDMGKFVQAMDALRARYPGCTVLIVHHSGHGDKDRGRGSIALKAACDFEYRLDKRGTRCVELVNCKMKDAERPDSVAFGIETVALGGGAESAVLRPATIIQNTEEALTPAQRLGIATYIEAAARAGIWDEDGFAGLHLEDWRSEFYAKHTADSTDSKKKAFQRVRTDLIRARHMVVNEDVYTVTGADVIMEIKLARATAGQTA